MHKCVYANVNGISDRGEFQIYSVTFEFDKVTMNTKRNEISENAF